MEDRELLELAAKAAGRDLTGWLWSDYVGAFLYAEQGCATEAWSPLNDDGDALRLAVKLELYVTPLPLYAERKYSVEASRKPLNGAKVPDEEFYAADPYAATRRAIVRAAAEIGKAMVSAHP